MVGKRQRLEMGSAVYSFLDLEAEESDVDEDVDEADWDDEEGLGEPPRNVGAC